MKVDVEGFEVFVLRPFLELITDSYRPTFLVELGWGRENPNWVEFMTVVEKLNEMKYLFFEADASRRRLSVDDLKKLNKTTDVIIEPAD